GNRKCHARPAGYALAGARQGSILPTHARMGDRLMNAMPRKVDRAADAAGKGQLISETLAEFAHGLTAAATPPQVRERARHLMLDATGIALASGRYDFAHKAMTAIAGLGGEGAVPVIGLPARLPPRDAALLNGILVHGLDFDDTHTGGVI